MYVVNNYLYVNPEEFDNNDLDIKNLSEILLIDEEDLKNYTRKRDLKYISIINKLSIESSDYIQNYIAEEKDALSK
ncbi:MAG: hypothetical protein LBD88_00150 [Candidatus Peribacteria bacterium]|nr:hypothetical protein [Candidatus Peribacteria bacterium]